MFVLHASQRHKLRDEVDELLFDIYFLVFGDLFLNLGDNFDQGLFDVLDVCVITFFEILLEGNFLSFALKG